MSAYFSELTAAMQLLARQPNVVFMGQAVAYDGTAMRKTLLGVPSAQLLELPVTEDMQLGLAIGMALNGILPICLYPRWNFLLLATNQLVLHLDKLPLYSAGGFRPKIILRTAVATPEPLDPGPQHLGNFTDAYRQILTTVEVLELHRADDIVPAYRAALQREGSSLLIEHTVQYG